MANNRMYIENKRLGVKIIIGKYYPSTGWHVRNDELADDIDSVFEKDDYVSLFGSTDWEITYETSSTSEDNLSS